MTEVPATNLDPFADEFLANPYRFHDPLRALGPVFKLSHYGIWGIARHSEVYAALNDWKTFCSRRGVGMADYGREQPWRPPSLLLETDPPVHERTRELVRKVLSRRALNDLKADWAERADRLVDHLVTRGSIDAIKDLAEVYPLSVFPDAVGIRADGRDNLLQYGSLAFNSFGPPNHLVGEAAKTAPAVTAWVADSCRRSSLSPGGFGAAVYEAADRGEATHEEAERLVRSFLSAGVDTTVNGLGNAVHCFVNHPAQWEKLLANPKLIALAFEEVMRFESPVQTFFRTTTTDVVVGDVTIPEGSKVLLFLAAANRDPRRWDNPEVFDIERKASGHVGFGAGIHACIGQMIARQEAELFLAALLRRVGQIAVNGLPRRRLNNTLFALESLPVTLIAR
jgi:cytochrome P450